MVNPDFSDSREGSDHEYSPDTSGVDMYSFGLCTSEMPVLKMKGNNDSGQISTNDHINSPPEYPEVQEPPMISDIIQNILEPNTNEVLHLQYAPEIIVAEIKYPESYSLSVDREETDSNPQFCTSDDPVAVQFDKLMEHEIGVYPLTCFDLPVPPLPSRQHASTTEESGSEKSSSPEPIDSENRRVVNMMCNIKHVEEGEGLHMTILVRMDDKMNRKLSCVVSETDTPFELASELVIHGFIHEDDRDKMTNLIEESIQQAALV